jgi:hypothetical protein
LIGSFPLFLHGKTRGSREGYMGFAQSFALPGAGYRA